MATITKGFHATCRGHGLDTDDPALFELHMRERHDGGTRRFVHLSSGNLYAPVTKLRTKVTRKLPALTPQEREWLGKTVRFNYGCRSTRYPNTKVRVGDVWALAPRPRHVWVTDGVECWEVDVSRLNIVRNNRRRAS